MFKPVRTLALFGLMLAATPALADVRSGVDAYQRGDYASAIAQWRPLADRGDPDAQFNLAQVYKLGRGVPANLDTAIGLYRKAAMQGHGEAEALLGLLLFQSGKRAEALPWLGKAADRGDAASQYVYGTALFNGDLVPKDLTRAYALMTRAASQGLPPARTALLEMDKYIPLAQRQQAVASARTAIATQPVRTASIAQPAARPTLVPRPPIATPRPVTVPAASVVATPAPSPIRATAPMRVAGWKVQLGAFSQPAGANALFASLKGRVGALRNTQPILTRAGAVTRLQAGPFAGRAVANAACAAVKAASGGACFAVAP